MYFFRQLSHARFINTPNMGVEKKKKKKQMNPYLLAKGEDAVT